MALLDDLVAKVEDEDLRAELAAAVLRLKKTRRFGLDAVNVRRTTMTLVLLAAIGQFGLVSSEAEALARTPKTAPVGSAVCQETLKTESDFVKGQLDDEAAHLTSVRLRVTKRELRGRFQMGPGFPVGANQENLTLTQVSIHLLTKSGELAIIAANPGTQQVSVFYRKNPDSTSYSNKVLQNARVEIQDEAIVYELSLDDIPELPRGFRWYAYTDTTTIAPDNETTLGVAWGCPRRVLKSIENGGPIRGSDLERFPN